MTTSASRTRVRADEGERLTARCHDCEVDLLLARDADVAAALASLDAAHPAREHRPVARAAPRGWLLRPPGSDDGRPPSAGLGGTR